MKKPKHGLTHVRHDPAHCLAPGLFRSLKRGERKRGKLDVTYTFGEDESMRFVGFEPLGADDMRLLQGIVALGGPNGILLTPEPTSETGRQLRLFLEPRFEAIEQDGLVVRESLTKLLSETGMTDSGDNIKALKASLLRMLNVTILVTKGRRQAAFHLMSHAFDEADGRLWVALNPRIRATNFLCSLTLEGRAMPSFLAFNSPHWGEWCFSIPSILDFDLKPI